MRRRDELSISSNVKNFRAHKYCTHEMVQESNSTLYSNPTTFQFLYLLALEQVCC